MLAVLDRCQLGIQVKQPLHQQLEHSRASHLFHLLVPRTQPQARSLLHLLVILKFHNRCPSMVASQGLVAARHMLGSLLGISSPLYLSWQSLSWFAVELIKKYAELMSACPLGLVHHVIEFHFFGYLC